MAWTASVVQVIDDADRVSAVVLYTDGLARKLLETISVVGLSSDGFRQRVESRRQQLEDSDALLKVIAPGFDLTIPPVVPPVPTPAQVWLTNYRLLVKLKGVVDQGVILPTDPQYTDLLALVKSTWKPEYIDIL